MLLSRDDFSNLLNSSGEEVKNRVIEILALSQQQPESPEGPECIVHIDA